MRETPTPADLARELGVSGLRVRGYLRERYPREAPGKGGLWELRSAQVDDVRAYFGGRHRSGPAISAAPAGPPPEPTAYQAEWAWEGNVQAAAKRRLELDGWSIVGSADAAARQRGDDIRAVRDSATLVVEVKGYPSRSYADPRRSDEVKRTNPTLQAKHWLAEAVFRSMRSLGRERGIGVAIALPDLPRYRDLTSEIAASLEALSIDVLWVTEADVRRLSATEM